MKRFLVADDHSIVRFGLKMMLETSFPGCTVDEASHGEDVMARMRENSYELILLDLIMPNTDTNNLLHFIRSFHSETKVLVVSMNEEALYGLRTIQLGAQGYLKKDAPKEELEQAVSMVLSGKRYISSELADLLIESSLEKKPLNPFERLTPREFQVATLMLQDLSPKQIGEALQIQYGTVSTLKHRIFEKLHITSRKQLVTLASTYPVPGQ
ncbi:response regulator transcription factor [Taibaiella koreensis]|uniref:response regulator transcription factor n=1 Tax=Taibaiella koreensis TaxID=1268548 RepID=UPI000E59B50B|nr:response regulator transcription factor [Taibaiella koreensis]